MKMRILAIVSGEYGQRHVANMHAFGSPDWQIEVWQAPAALPAIIDYPEDFLPDTLPPADLILSFGEQAGIAELLPEIAQMTGAKAVLAPIDREEWLPRGLARQLHGWLAAKGVACVTPKPLCTLTEDHYNFRQNAQEYSEPHIAEVARWFGKPTLSIDVDPKSREIRQVRVLRDAFCGCAQHVAAGLVGLSADDAEEKAGLLHHHYPCLASMGIDSELGDTLMHVSGNILKNEVGEQVKPYRQVTYLVPGAKSEDV